MPATNGYAGEVLGNARKFSGRAQALFAASALGTVGLTTCHDSNRARMPLSCLTCPLHRWTDNSRGKVDLGKASITNMHM